MNSKTTATYLNTAKIRKSPPFCRWYIILTLFGAFISSLVVLNSSYAQDENLPVYLSTVDSHKADALMQAGWKGAYLNPAGMNVKNGVEVFTRMGKCDTEDFVFLKLINHNTYDVQIEWIAGIYTNDHQWIGDKNSRLSSTCNPEKNSATSNQKIEGVKSITIKANDEVTGDCSYLSGESITGFNREFLVINLKENSCRTDNFNRYAPASFAVTLK